MADDDRPVLPGSTRRPLASSRAAGTPDPAEQVAVTLVLRRRSPLTDTTTPMSREEFAAAHGADPEDVQRVRDTLTAAGIDVTDVDAASRRIQARGEISALERLFGTTLELVESPDPVAARTVIHRQRTGALAVPDPLAGVVVAVLGLDDRPQGRARFVPAAAASSSFTPLELGTIYRFPTGTTGQGQTLAILELGGGFTAADLDAYWQRIGVTDPPSVTAVGVDGAVNAPESDPSGADGEVLLDIEVAGALAPGSDVVVYFAPNTDRGFLDALATAVHADPTPAAVSISWGQSEDQWTGQAMTAMDDALADAAALGVTVCVASGDNGSVDNGSDGHTHVDFPAASPHALACGGTTLQADPSSGSVRSETVWFHGEGQGGSGGGVSDVFGVPSWQSAVGVPGDPDTGGTGRGVPDVGGDADPATGYAVRVDGRDMVIGGTSAVAPLWAALVCRLAEALGRPPGLLQPALYARVGEGAPAPGLRDITTGSNGAYRAGPGWDACTGLGVPDGEALLERLRGTSG
jgi:kumamolisin